MRAYERFIDYVKVHTTSSETSGTHPSFKGEFDLAGQLRDELISLGLENVKMDEHCYVYGYLPASKGHENAKTLGFIAHVDTVDEAPGENVKPILHENFNGEEVTLPGSGVTLKVDKYPELRLMKGETLITSDGTTLLGADDKAGVAEIMTLLETLTQSDKTDNAIPHGPIWVAFTPDEEIGEGTEFFDLDYFKADFGYTVDGGDCNLLENENFNAAALTVKVNGFSVHPGDAKDKMINASKVLMEYHSYIPEMMCPECTEKREGFFHMTEIKSTVLEGVSSYIIRDHDKSLFEEKKKMARDIADKLNLKYGSGTVTVEIKDSYYNMLEKIKPHMHLVDNAISAIKSAGLVPEIVPIRGGTDGAMLSYKGFPCPNLGTGGFFFHGLAECISVERMDKVVEILVNIVRLYA